MRSGTYELPSGLIVTKPVVIEGQGMENSLVRCSSGNCVLTFSGPSQWSIHGIGFEYFGAAPSNVVEIVGGQAKISRCSFFGATSVGEFGEHSGGGFGLLLEGGTNSSISYCHSHGNSKDGIAITGSSKVDIIETRCRANGRNGIIYGGNAAENAGGANVHKTTMGYSLSQMRNCFSRKTSAPTIISALCPPERPPPLLLPEATNVRGIA